MVQQAFRRAGTERINLRNLYNLLLSPPIGMKAGVIPVFLTVALLVRRDDIAIYEHGTFKPLLTADLSERMVRNPGHFEIKHFANTTGARGGRVVAALEKQLRVGGGLRRYRVPNVVAVVGHLVSKARQLDRYTLRTRDLSERAAAVRNVLVAAVEPDQMLFDALPAALGYPPVNARVQDYVDANKYARAVAKTLEELSGRPDRLLSELLHVLLETSAEESRRAVSGQAAALDGQILDPEVRAFVLTLANDAVENDFDWIRAIATVVAKKAPSEWADEDIVHFRRELRPRVAAFRRLVALHADNRVDGGGPFKAARITLTRADGREHVRLAAVDEDTRLEAERIVGTAMTDLMEVTGSPDRATDTLLAVVTERLLPDEAERVPPLPQIHRKVASG